MKNFSLLLLFGISSFISNAQHQPWSYLQNEIDGDHRGVGYKSIMMADGTILSMGTIGSIAHAKTLLVSKLDLDGNILWEKSFQYINPFSGEPTDIEPNSITASEDNGAILSAEVDLNDIWICKIDEDGNVVWATDSFVDGFTALDYKEALAYEISSGDVVSVYTKSPYYADPSSLKMVTIDTLGTISNIGGIGPTFYLDDVGTADICEVVKLPSGGFIYGGVKDVLSPESVLFLIAFNEDLEFDWSAEYDLDDAYNFTGLIPASDGNFYMCGHERIIEGETENASTLILKLDNAGNILWSYSDDLSDNDFSVPLDINITSDNRVVVLSKLDDDNSLVHDPGNIYELRYIDSDGDLLHYKSFKYFEIVAGGSEPYRNDYFTHILPTPDGEICLTGCLQTDDFLFGDPPNFLTVIKSLDDQFPECLINCVWPGDCNNDSDVNATDVLSIGLAYGELGINRTSADNAWYAHESDVWASIVAGVNTKYVDSDGNGIVNDDDTLAINMNYGLTHPVYDFRLSDIGPTLYLQSETDILTEGSVSLDIMLDDEGASLDIYGLGFQINYSGTAEVASGTFINIDDSWIGTSDDLLFMQKDFDAYPYIQAGLTRRDHTNKNGAGKIGTITYQIADIGEPGIIPLQLNVNNITATLQNGEIIIINNSTFSFAATTGITSNISENSLEIFPNPAENVFFIQGKNLTAQSIQLIISDNTGRKLIEESMQDYYGEKYPVDIHDLPTGMYVINLIGEDFSQAYKLIVE